MHWTPLHLASWSWRAEVVEILLEHGVDVNAQNSEHSTPLHQASSNGSLHGPEIVRLLIKHGADVNAQDNTHLTPLHHASSRRFRGLRLSIAEAAALCNLYSTTNLHLVSPSGSAETERLLIEKSTDVNAMDRRQYMLLPSHLASWGLETVRLLIKYGADVNAQNKTHSTPLHLASLMRLGETVELLIQLGADVNAHDEEHSTPLHIATSLLAVYDDTSIVHLLLSNGANVDEKDDSGRTPFQIASAGGFSEIAELSSDYCVREE